MRTPEETALEPHRAAIIALLERIGTATAVECGTGVRDSRSVPVTWPMVGTAAHVRELLVQAAFALGELDEAEALREHGVTL